KQMRWTGNSWSVTALYSHGGRWVDAGYVSIDIDSSDHPHVSWAGAGYINWTGNSWNKTYINAGRFTSIALDPQEYPHISYWDVISKDLKHTKWTGSSWQTETVDSIGDVGQGTHIAIDPSGHPRISYWDSSNNNLKYAQWTGSSWSIEIVDSLGAEAEVTSMAIDSRGYPHISYRANNDGDLRYAKRTPFPNMPTNFRASSHTTHSITWSWEDNSSNETGYGVITHAGDSVSGNLEADSTAWNETGLLPNTAYSRRALVFNDLGVSTSAEVTNYTLAVPPTGFAVTDVYTSSIAVSWQANSNPEHTLYEVFYSSIPSHLILFPPEERKAGGVLRAEGGNNGSGDLRAAVSGLLPGTTCYLSIRAVNEDGFATTFNISVATRTKTLPAVPPAAVTTVNAFQTGIPNTVRIVWDVPDGNGTIGTLLPVTRYLIQHTTSLASVVWSTSNAQTNISIAGVSMTAIDSVMHLDANEVHYFKVWAVDEAGNHSKGSPVAEIFNSPLTFTRGKERSSYFNSSIAIDKNNNLHIVYQDDSGSLNYVKRTGFLWSVPKIIDSSAICEFFYIAIDEWNNPQIAYYDSTNGDLKHAGFNGAEWSTATVDSDGDIGPYVSIAIDQSGNQHISYQDVTNQDLKYAQLYDNIWTTSTIAMDGGYFTSIAVDESGKPHISYYDSNSNTLKYAKHDIGGWDISVVGSVGDGCAFTSIVLDEPGNPHISCYNLIDLDLQYAKFDGMDWSIATVDSEGNVGAGSSMVLDGSGRPHITYVHNDHLDGPDVKYAKFDNEKWSKVTVNGGFSASISLDASGNPHIAYNGEDKRPYSDNSKVTIAHWIEDGFPPATESYEKAYVPAPVGFLAEAVHSTSITWSWTDHASDEIGFRLYGNTNYSGKYSVIADSNTIGPNTTYFTETDLEPGTTYYRYIAVMNSWSIALSNHAYGYIEPMLTPISSSGPEVDTSTSVAITQPVLSAVVLGESSIAWTWSDAGNVDGYRVVNSTDGFDLSGSLALGTTTWIESGLTAGTTYTRYVAAFNEADSIDSDAVSVYLPPINAQHDDKPPEGPVYGCAMVWLDTPKEWQRLKGNAVTLMAGVLAKDVSSVLFQYRTQGDAVWHSISSIDKESPFSVYWDLSDLADGAYELRPLAFD
ncbi:hypothetical protein ACFL6Y_11740, partial [Elusimicrobiota bacterium]